MEAYDLEFWTERAQELNELNELNKRNGR